MRRTPFTNDDITCIENRCTIKTTIEGDVTRTLTLSPHLDNAFNVLESSYKDKVLKQNQNLNSSVRSFKNERSQKSAEMKKKKKRELEEH